MALEDTIQKIIVNIKAANYQNETTVREAVVLPVLSELGWDTLDPQVVLREYKVKSRRVDYALTTGSSTPIIIIEVKAIGQALGGDIQLFEYAFHEGVPMAILTDGSEWSFYLPGEHGSYEDRRVYKLDLLERGRDKSCEMLRKYLGFDRVKSGDAIEAAREDYQSASKKRQAKQAVPEAWRQLLNEPDELLIELVSEKAEILCGFRPEIEQIEKFLIDVLSQQVSGSRSSPPAISVSATLPHPSASFGTRASSPGKIGYQLFGKPLEARNAKEALVEILQELEKRDSNFFEKLSYVVQGRKRNHIANSKQGVYPDRPDLADTAIEISPGWWIGINIANREKKRILIRACEVAKIQFGKDLVIELPNA